MLIGLVAIAGGLWPRRDPEWSRALPARDRQGDPLGAAAQAPQTKGPAAPRVIAVAVAPAVKKSTPVQIEALGTVTPMASVAIKSRVDSEITEIHFADGATRQAGRPADHSSTAARSKRRSRQAEGNVRARQGAARRRRSATSAATPSWSRRARPPVTNLDNAKTQAAIYAATLKADEATLKNLQVQLSYTTIRAPITGRISAATVKVGNFVRSADLLPIATIIQIAPIYVSFPVPQRDAARLARGDRRQGTPSVERSDPGRAGRPIRHAWP